MPTAGEQVAGWTFPEVRELLREAGPCEGWPWAWVPGRGLAEAKVVGLMGSQEDEKWHCGRRTGQERGQAVVRRGGGITSGLVCRPYRRIRDWRFYPKNREVCFQVGDRSRSVSQKPCLVPVQRVDDGVRGRRCSREPQGEAQPVRAVLQKRCHKGGAHAVPTQYGLLQQIVLEGTIVLMACALPTSC